MKADDFAKGTPWAIHTPALQEMIARTPEILDRITPEALTKFVENPESYEPDEFQLRDGVAIIPVYGMLVRQASYYAYLFGGRSSMTDLSRVVLDAVNDSDVDAILLDFDSPGGTIAGTEAFSSVIAEAREEKPVVAFASGGMLSAAYWIGSAATRIVAEPTAQLGSIGVVTTHFDWSENDKQMGLKRTVIASGKYKAMGNDAQPLPPEAEKEIQARLDYLYSLFVHSVAGNLRAEPEQVLRDMADGRVFIGRQAVDAGLAHQVGGMQTALTLAGELAEAQGPQTYYFNLTTKENAMDPKKKTKLKQTIVTFAGEAPTIMELAAALPDLVEAIRAEGLAAADHTDAVASAETRILDLAKVHFGTEPGEAFAKMVGSGVTVEQFSAIREMAGIKAETVSGAPASDKAKEGLNAAINAAGPGNPGSGGGADGSGKDFMALVSEYQALNKCSKADAMQAVQASNPKAHEAYLQKYN